MNPPAPDMRKSRCPKDGTENHACLLAAREAEGDWLLLLDAVTVHTPTRAPYSGAGDRTKHRCFPVFRGR